MEQLNSDSANSQDSLKVISTRELLKQLQISRTTLYSWIAQGKIFPLKNLKKNNRLFLVEDVAKMILAGRK